MYFLKHLQGESCHLAPWDAVHFAHKHGGTHGAAAALLGRRLGSAVSAHRLPRRAGNYTGYVNVCFKYIFTMQYLIKNADAFLEKPVLGSG